MDYWDFLQSYANSYVKNRGHFGSMSYDLYNRLYDSSHGSDRYWLSKIPFYSWLRYLEDQSKKAQDQYDNSGTDPAYIDRVADGAGSNISNVVGRAVRMARSLEGVYTPEVIENVQSRTNNMYW